MRLCDVGWCWEGQGLDPGVHPSILGVGGVIDGWGIDDVRYGTNAAPEPGTMALMLMGLPVGLLWRRRKA